MRTSAHRLVAEHGYRTALAFFRRTAARQRRLFAKHGIGFGDPRRIRGVPPPPPPRAGFARALDDVLDRLEAKLR
jgi:hypothetical protein